MPPRELGEMEAGRTVGTGWVLGGWRERTFYQPKVTTYRHCLIGLL